MFNLVHVINDPKTMLTMKDRKDIISEYDRTGSIRATARSLGLNRKTVGRYVQEYLEERGKSDAEYTAYLKSEPHYKRGSVRAKKVLTEAVRALIDGFLNENEEKKRRGDRKLCMKATDIHSALQNAGYKVSYPTVTKYIQSKGMNVTREQECYIRQVYSPGIDCEFDWGELHLKIDGRRMKLYIAVFTLAYSNVRMAFLFLRQDTTAFLESHKMCFDIFNGVPHRMIYDNMRVAVAASPEASSLPMPCCDWSEPTASHTASATSGPAMRKDTWRDPWNMCVVWLSVPATRSGLLKRPTGGCMTYAWTCP